MAFTLSPIGYSRARSFGVGSVVLIGRSGFFSQLEADIDSVFFSQLEFGESIQYYHYSIDEWKTYKTIFDNPHTSLSAGVESEFNTIRPQWQLQESKMAASFGRGDKLLCRGVTYDIVDYISDGVGVTTFYGKRSI